MFDLDAIIAKVAAIPAEQQPGGFDLDAAIASVSGGRGEPGLLVLSNGLGRDSATIIALLVQGKLKIGGKRVKPSDVDLVVFSDTGNEWTFTTEAAARAINALLDKAGVPHVNLEKPPPAKWKPYIAIKRDEVDRLMAAGVRGRQFSDRMTAWSKAHPPPWLDVDWEARARKSGRLVWAQKAIGGGYHRRPPILAQRKTLGWGTYRVSHACTIGHKIDPIDAFLNDLTLDRWGIPVRLKRGEKGDSWEQRVLRGEAQPHRLIIGMAADEQGRIARGQASMADYPWKTGVYPLAEMGITKAGETEVLKQVRVGGKQRDLNFVRKSGCKMCHFAPDSWFWALAQTEPQEFAEIEAYERRANRKNPNYTIKDKRRITTKRDAIPALVRLSGVDPEGRVGQQRVAVLNKRLNKAAALEQLTRRDPSATALMLIGEVVQQWREANPTATVDAVLSKSYERCGGFNRCPACAGQQDLGVRS